jgi:hypothetical protein
VYWGLFARRLANDLPEALRPPTDLRNGRATIASDKWLNSKIAQGEVAIVKGWAEQVTSEGVIVNGVLIPADIIVLATGFQPTTFGLAEENEIFWLYRGVLDPWICNFAVVGYGKVVYTQLNISLQAAWLCDLLRGTVTLPAISTMQEEVQAHRAALQAAYGENAHQFAYIWNEIRYYDQLLSDMHIQTHRKGTLFADLVEQPNPLDYKLVLTHRV